jgi:hypothetical protein
VYTPCTATLVGASHSIIWTLPHNLVNRHAACTKQADRQSCKKWGIARHLECAAGSCSIKHATDARYWCAPQHNFTHHCISHVINSHYDRPSHCHQPAEGVTEARRSKVHVATCCRPHLRAPASLGGLHQTVPGVPQVATPQHWQPSWRLPPCRLLSSHGTAAQRTWPSAPSAAHWPAPPAVCAAVLTPAAAAVLPHQEHSQLAHVRAQAVAGCCPLLC